MPIIEVIFPLREPDRQELYKVHVIDQIYFANEEIFDFNNPSDVVIVDQHIGGEAALMLSIHQALDKMGVSDVSYFYNGTSTSL